MNTIFFSPLQCKCPSASNLPAQEALVTFLILPDLHSFDYCPGSPPSPICLVTLPPRKFRGHSPYLQLSSCSSVTPS